MRVLNSNKQIIIVIIVLEMDRYYLLFMRGGGGGIHFKGTNIYSYLSLNFTVKMCDLVHK